MPPVLKILIIGHNCWAKFQAFIIKMNDFTHIHRTNKRILKKRERENINARLEGKLFTTMAG